jgi:hypothetical protein
MEPRKNSDAEQEIQVSIDSLTKVVERNEKLNRLIDNKDFKELILEIYLEKEPARLTQLLTDQNFLTDNPDVAARRKDEIIEELTAISSFRKFLINIGGLARQAKTMIDSSEEELESLRNIEEE